MPLIDHARIDSIATVIMEASNRIFECQNRIARKFRWRDARCEHVWLDARRRNEQLCVHCARRRYVAPTQQSEHSQHRVTEDPAT